MLTLHPKFIPQNLSSSQYRVFEFPQRATYRGYFLRVKEEREDEFVD